MDERFEESERWASDAPIVTGSDQPGTFLVCLGELRGLEYKA